MQLGVCSLFAKDPDFFKSLPSQGIRWIEVHWNREPFTNAGIKDVQELLNVEGLSVTMHAPYKNIEPSSLLKKTIESIEAAYALETPLIVMHPWKDLAVLRKMCRKAQDNGIRVVLENMEKQVPALIYDLAELKSTAKELGCGLCIDFAHLVRRGLDIPSSLQMCEGLIEHVHLSDATDEATHVPLGRGELYRQKNAVLRFMQDFEGICVLEGGKFEFSDSLARFKLFLSTDKM